MSPDKHHQQAIEKPLTPPTYVFNDTRLGRDYFHRTNLDQIAFQLNAIQNKLSTQSLDPTVVHAMMDTAVEKGFKEIKLSGTKEFKRDAWLAAMKAGLTVRGYQPSQAEQQLLGISPSPVQADKPIKADGITAKPIETATVEAVKALHQASTLLSEPSLQGEYIARGERIIAEKIVKHQALPDDSSFERMLHDEGDKLSRTPLIKDGSVKPGIEFDM